MKKIIFIIIGAVVLAALAFIFLSGGNKTPSPNEQLQTSYPAGESNYPSSTGKTKYLAFQIFTSSALTTMAPVSSLSKPISKQELSDFVDTIINKIGETGNASRKLAFILGPLAFDHTDDQNRELIQNAFQVAEEKNIAVGFHIDDSMYWWRRTDLWKNPQNVEWTDWNGTVHPHRYVDWIANATLAPQMCYTSPRILAEVKRLSHDVIGAEIKKGIDRLAADGKSYLFAGVIAGWETHLADYSMYSKISPDLNMRMSRDGAPKVKIGYCALHYLGYSAKNPPKDFDLELAKVVQNFAAYWAKQLYDAGIPKTKIYTHIAYDPNIDKLSLDTLRAGLGVENPSRLAIGRHSPFWTAFNNYSSPGFSTYPNDGIFDAIYGELAKNGNPAWGSSEGTSEKPDSQSRSGPTMDSYLNSMFGHGATLVDVFAWGLGGQPGAPQNLVSATNDDAAIAAYKKFLNGEKLIEK